ncbi:MAG: EFR1 family ferrodoxin [Muribaculaceae bacterium]|nr:EFR1 family ferrodoxin [Muribaculaceae bacterium]
MVLYFSGTGNSTFVATTIANFLNQKLLFIPEIEPSQLEFSGDRLVIIFPVYSWGVPPLVVKFIENIPQNIFEWIIERDIPVDCVMTCGDEVALAPEMIQKVFNKKGVRINSVRSVIMPNNYVLLPGFDVDSKELENKKLKLAEGRIMEITQAILRQDKGIDVVRGSIPWLKSRLVYPLFKKWGVFPQKWHFLPSCIGCGKCARICPLSNVKMVEGNPNWGRRCCSCLGCYHICPVHAVEYGKETKKKGQYIFPLKEIATKNFH